MYVYRKYNWLNRKNFSESGRYIDCKGQSRSSLGEYILKIVNNKYFVTDSDGIVPSPTVEQTKEEMLEYWETLEGEKLAL